MRNAKDKDGLIYIRNSCAMALEMNGQARDRIKSISSSTSEREFDGLNQDADSRYNNQKTIKDLGAAADLGGLDELTGIWNRRCYRRNIWINCTRPS